MLEEEQNRILVYTHEMLGMNAHGASKVPVAKGKTNSDWWRFDDPPEIEVVAETQQPDGTLSDKEYELILKMINTLNKWIPDGGSPLSILCSFLTWENSFYSSQR